MKAKFDWKFFIILFIVIFGLYLLTGSFLTTAGIMVILLLIDGFLREYDSKQRAKRQWEEIHQKLSDDDDSQEGNAEVSKTEDDDQ